MRSLRRSLNGRDHHHGGSGHPPISGPIATLPAVSRPNLKTQPPKKVIRALESYRPTAPQELGFSKGDFFHVIQDSDENSGWYEAHNPVTGARGLVPKHLFEEFSRPTASVRTASARESTSITSILTTATPPSRSPPPVSPRLKTFFAVVVHDFQAERPDELDAHAGDNISVVAQSNREWFVAKPIGKLGRPGLIPVAFVDVKDPASGQTIPEDEVTRIMDRGDIPRVEEWKKAMVAYKAASIPLGVIDDSNSSPVPNSPFMQYPPQSSTNAQTSNTDPLNRPTTIGEASEELDAAHNAPTNPLPNDNNTSANHHDPLPFGLPLLAEVVSFHFENEEYWFRVNATWRALDNVTLSPIGELRKLILFRVYDDFYDFQIQLLSAFPKEAGREPDPATDSGLSTRILPYMPGPVEQVDDIVTSLRQEELDQYLVQLCGLIQNGAHHILNHELVQQFFSCKPGDVQTYEVDDFRTEAQELEEPPLEELRGLSLEDQFHGQPASLNHERYNSQTRNVYPSDDRSHSEVNHSVERLRGNGSLSISSQQDESARNFGTVTTRSRSGSNANNPPISATNPQTAFIKIKIFDRTSDDLIAIRVSPKVSHRQLMEKVRERLGGEVNRLNYRNTFNTGFVPLLGDDNLRTWLEQTDKHVLYAE